MKLKLMFRKMYNQICRISVKKFVIMSYIYNSSFQVLCTA